MTYRTFFSLMTIIGISYSCMNYQQTDDPIKAGNEYCNCLSENKKLPIDSASMICMEKVAEEHRLLKIYLTTRDTIITNLYDKKTVDEVSVFVASFSKRIYGCYEKRF